MRRRRRRKKRVIQICIIASSIFALIFTAGLAYMEMRPVVVKAVILEAGTPYVDANDFLLDKSKSCSFVTDLASLNLNAPGIYEVQIKVNKRVHASSLEIIDSVAPTAEPVHIITFKGDRFEAEDFVSNVKDVTDVKVSFANEVDFITPGDKDVKVILEDAGSNIKIIDSKLTIVDIKISIQVEAGTELDVKAEDFLNNSDANIRILSDLSEVDINKPGEYMIQIDVDGRILDSYINVVDTTPPTAIARNVEVWVGDELPPIHFVDDIRDLSPVDLYYASEPVFEAEGEQDVHVIVEDYYGNKIEIISRVTVKEDTKPPVFTGIEDKTVFVGEAISYRKGVSVFDNRDMEVSFKVDSSNVNLNKAGSYKVYYSAVDRAGNNAEKEATITVKQFAVSDEELYGKVDKVLNEITKDGMTQREIAWEIYRWIKGHVSYIGTSDKSDWKKEAYRGIVNGVGDCFTYYAVSEALLTRAGIDNMLVTRVGGRTQHFWNLINCGDGWYHFDTCPNKDKMQSFMLTDAEVEAYTKKRGNNYYNFDKSLYPATPEE